MMSSIKCISIYFNIIFFIVKFEHAFSVKKSFISNPNVYYNNEHYSLSKNLYQNNNRARYLHGGDLNYKNGGTCAEFKRLNGLTKCCHPRNDECYMIHFDSRCYCDTFCSIDINKNVTDCCPDANIPNGQCSSRPFDLSVNISKCK